MIERETKVESFKVDAFCECGGIFERKDPFTVLTTYPCKYPHTCNKCGKSESFYEEYPKIIYKEI